MIRHFIWLLVLYSWNGNTQATFSHYGGLKMHPGANIGLHGNLINYGTFEQSEGLIGFYGSESIRVSGEVPLVIHDLEIATNYRTLLDLTLSIENNLNFISGDIENESKNPMASVQFLPGSFSNGASDFSKVTGYVTASLVEEFVFPVGDRYQIRPLQFNTENSSATLHCAFFRENPVISTNFGMLDSLAKPRELETIGTHEFWRLEGDSPGAVTMFWNAESNLPAIAQDVEQLELIGWQKSTQSWQLLGTVKRNGDLQEGFAISAVFTPDDYEVLTFGGRRIPKKFYKLDNYYLSPNNDGINDVLEIEELLDAPNNILKIYDRRGLLVFSVIGYSNQFNGFSNISNNVIDRNSGLPQGVYYYVAHLLDAGETYQGFLYLDR